MAIFWAHQDSKFGKTPIGKKDLVQVGAEVYSDLLSAMNTAEISGCMIGKIECSTHSIKWIGGDTYKVKRPLGARFTTLDEIETEYLS